MRKKNVHFVGIKGAGMAPLAVLVKEAGMNVSGCDIGESFITDGLLNNAGISFDSGFSSDHLNNVDLVIATGAHGGWNNLEIVAARARGISVLSYGQAVGIFMDGNMVNRNDLIGISVAGTHGKTTTAALIATIFMQAGLDPSYIVGTSHILPLGASGHFGTGNYFVAEADEYVTDPLYDKTPKFLWQHPKIAVLTNIEFDHPDVYASLDDITKAFEKFVRQIPDDGVLIANGDDGQVLKIAKYCNSRVILYGNSSHNNFNIRNVRIKDTQMFFWVDAKQTNLGEFSMSITGQHNALNGLAAFICALEAGIGVENAKKMLSVYKGSKRRSELVGQTKEGLMLFDDYAHHPTEIKKTLSAFKSSFPNKKIVCVFQPHTFSRTKILFEQFIHSFTNAYETVIMDIFSSQREEFDTTVSSKDMVEEISKFSQNIHFLPKALDVVKYIQRKHYGSEYLLITMGAGDVYKVGLTLLSSK